MYQIDFAATDDADWSQAVALIDNNTDGPLTDAADARFDMEIGDCGRAIITASTEDATIQHPEPNVVQWVVPKAKMGSLCPGKTYTFGLTMTTISGTVQIAVGSLAIINGGF